MTARTATRVAPRAIARPLWCSQPRNSRRTFFSLPSAEPQTLSARRTLPYASQDLYELIADINSYSRFLPYCTVSRVTSWSPIPNPDTNHKYPTAGTLTAGWSGLSETYSSRVFCLPHLGIVEAISGDAVTLIPASELQRCGLTDPGPRRSPAGVQQEGTFKSLVTRWTVQPLAGQNGRQEDAEPWSQVDLSIRFQFVNPLYAAVSSAVADKVAPIMVEAFEKEAQRVLRRSGARK